MHARWRTRAAICCALVCSVFSVGNVDAEETGNTQANVETIKNQTYAIMQDVDALRAQVELMVEDVGVLSQLEYWFGTVRTAINSLDTYIRSGVDLRPETLRVFSDYFDSVQGSMSSIRTQLNGVGTVTNFLGYSDFQDATHAFWDVFSQTYGEIGDTGYGAIYVIPIQANMEAEIADYLSATPGDNDPQQGVGRSSWQTATHAYAIRQWLEALDLSALSPASTTNLLTIQNTTLERVAEYVAGVSNAVGTISNEYETDPTGSNALPAEKKPADLEVEKSVDTSSLEEAVQQTFDGLDSLTPTGASTVPEIMIMDSYRDEDPIKVKLDLSEISIGTRICKACWAILLAVGVLGVVRSEWDYWTTLGGSAT